MSTKTPHGPDQCHRIQCYAPPCKERTQSYRAAHARHSRRQRAYGRWNPYVDAGPVRDHVAILRASGMGLDRIAELSQVARKSLVSLTSGVEGRPPSRHTRTTTAQKLFAVRPNVDLLLPGARTDATGTRRRLQALQRIGWSQRTLAEELDTTQKVVGFIIRGYHSRVQASTAIRVRKLYDQLWSCPPVASTQQEGYFIARVRKNAEDRGWAPPMAWDDDEIDDPTAQPAETRAGSSGAARKLPEDDELLWLVRMGETDAALAMRFGVGEGTVRDARHRAERKTRAAVAA
jgi:DNA-binding CsgD family transcriptional regulator